MKQTRITTIISPARICTIAGHTFTQLVRMKVFYFLVIFALLLLGLQLIDMPYTSGAGGGLDQNIRLIKSAGFFAMNTFSFILALAATALLIPKDVEDRTLYTILSKPVPRLDYLFGKLFGVIALLVVSLLVMDVIFSSIIYLRVESVVAEDSELLLKMGKPQAMIDAHVSALRAQGVNLALQAGVLGVFLKALVVASVALLISTFSTSTIFTMIVTVMVVLMGLIQAEAREYFMEQQALGGHTVMSEVTRFIALLFPDFKLLGIEDAVIDGKLLPAGIIMRVSLIAVFYSAIYVVLSWFVFRKKEI